MLTTAAHKAYNHLF